MSSLFDCKTFKQKQQRHKTVLKTAAVKSQWRSSVYGIICHSVCSDSTTEVGHVQTLNVCSASFLHLSISQSCKGKHVEGWKLLGQLYIRGLHLLALLNLAGLAWFGLSLQLLNYWSISILEASDLHFRFILTRTRRPDMKTKKDHHFVITGKQNLRNTYMHFLLGLRL